MPATLQAPGEQQSLANTMGAMLIGCIASGPLFGMSVLQLLHYVQEFPKDNRIFKWIAWAVVILDSIHFAFISHTVYFYFVTNYYDERILTRIVWSVVAESLPTSATASIVQCFYAHRIWILSGKNLWLPAVVLICVVATAGFGIAWLVFAFQAETFQKLLDYSALAITINALSMANDVYIAVCLSLILWRKRTDLGDTNTVINRIAAFMIGTGSLTSACAFFSLLTLAIWPHTLIYAAFYFCLGRLYTNSMLASLNARKIFFRRNPTGPSIELAVAPSRSGIRVETRRTVWRDKSPDEITEDLYESSSVADMRKSVQDYVIEDSTEA